MRNTETSFMPESSADSRIIFSHKCMSSIVPNDQGPVVQSIISFTNSLMTNSLTVVAKVFSNTLIFLLQKCATHIFSTKIINVFAIFQGTNFIVTFANNVVNF